MNTFSRIHFNETTMSMHISTLSAIKFKNKLIEDKNQFTQS